MNTARLSPCGKFLAYAIGYDWTSGIEGFREDTKKHEVKIFVHEVVPEDFTV